jgi:3-oxoacyl-(acyl-carrier-protein) synthase
LDSQMDCSAVITGAGLVSPLGNTLTAYCGALMAGECAIRCVEYQAPAGTTRRMVAPVDDIPLAGAISELETRHYSQIGLLAAFCAEAAMDEAGLDMDRVDVDRCGVIFGSGFMNLKDLEPVYQKFFAGDERNLSPLVIPINMASSPAGRIGMHYGFHGVTRTVSTACSSASSAMVDAWQRIASGECDVVIAGGADLVCCTSLVRSWERLRILCPETEDPIRACRPFDRARNGLALGDGAALFVIESQDHAIRRGASILARLRAGFENSDGFDLLKPSADGAARCVNGALARAAVEPGDVDLLFAHGTATQLNDRTEVQALGQVFGERLAEIPVCAIKGQVGHSMGASGAMSIAAALGSIANGFVYPVPGFEEPDDGIDLRISAEGLTDDSIRNVLINCFAFGGANACLVLSKGDVN